MLDSRFLLAYFCIDKCHSKKLNVFTLNYLFEAGWFTIVFETENYIFVNVQIKMNIVKN